MKFTLHTNSRRTWPCDYTIWGNKSYIYSFIWYNHWVTIRQVLASEVYSLRDVPNVNPQTVLNYINHNFAESNVLVEATNTKQLTN